ncbi:hypothetical protein [Paenibacillus chartarius]|uniref:hypothetical protein n=1 Tax=Paenibacillus chartarius TaxID=747481 RepID=UPI00366BBE1B
MAVRIVIVLMAADSLLPYIHGASSVITFDIRMDWFTGKMIWKNSQVLIIFDIFCDEFTIS